MQIAVTGARGQLGSELMRRLSDDAVGLTHDEIEIADGDMVDRRLTQIRPRLVINTAADNSVDRAEEDPERAFRVNALGPRNLSKWCAANDAVLVHVSTDYVFGGDADRNRPWTESDPPLPPNAYAVSKLAGEYFVRTGCPRHFVVRTCGLYGGQPGRGWGNFIETVLRLGRESGTVPVVNDQRCCPTSAVDLAEALIELMCSEAWGLYHATNTGETTWYEFAKAVFGAVKPDVAVTPITTAEFGAAAPRPAYSVLDCTKLESIIGRPLPPWQDALAGYVANIERQPPVSD